MASLSKAEYLKRYLSADSEETQVKKKRRKRKIAVAPVSRIKIVDDDVDLKALHPDPSLGPTSLDEIDEAPTVADFVDDRPEDVKQMEAFRDSDRWKLMTKDKEMNEGESPPRRRRHDSDSSASDQNGGMIDMPKRHDSGSDQSPPRTRRHDSDSGQSPPRTLRHDSDSDQLPPRTKNLDSDSDQSPVRKNNQNSDSDQSPPRKRTKSDSDQSPVRRNRKDSDSDQSPPRKKKEENVRQSSRWGQEEKEDKKMKETLSGKKAGLSSAQEMKREMDEVKRKENEAFKKIDDKTLGKHAETVVRGRRRKIAEENEEKARKMAEREKKYEAWGQGLKQQEIRAQNLDDHMHEMSKPLARHEGDEDLESLLKEKERDGDPMAAFMRKKKSKGPQTKKKEYPVYKGPQPPPNRFGIRPGYRWDGVNRSTGFEKKIFEQIASKKARETDAYKWSIEDM